MERIEAGLQEYLNSMMRTTLEANMPTNALLYWQRVTQPSLWRCPEFRQLAEISSVVSLSGESFSMWGKQTPSKLQKIKK